MIFAFLWILKWGGRTLIAQSSHDLIQGLICWHSQLLNVLTSSVGERGMTLFYYLLLELKLITQNLCEIRWVK